MKVDLAKALSVEVGRWSTKPYAELANLVYPQRPFWLSGLDAVPDRLTGSGAPEAQCTHHSSAHRCCVGNSGSRCDPAPATALATAASAPIQKWKGIDAKGIDQVKLATLWALLEHRPYADESITEFATLAEGSEDGPWVFRIPRPLIDLLAGIDTEQAHIVAREWAGTEEFKLDRWMSEAVVAVLDELRTLARQAVNQKKPLLMWMSL